LSRYKSHDDARRADTDLLAKYISAQVNREELQDWTVRLVSSGQAVPEKSIKINGLEVGLVYRAAFQKEVRKDRYSVRRLVSPADETIGLSKDAIGEALRLTVERWKKSTRRNKAKLPPTQPGGGEIRIVRGKNNALLLIYPLDPEPAEVVGYEKPIMGIAISFPKSDTAREVTYTVNNIYTAKGGDDDSI